LHFLLENSKGIFFDNRLPRPDPQFPPHNYHPLRLRSLDPLLISFQLTLGSTSNEATNEETQSDV